MKIQVEKKIPAKISKTPVLQQTAFWARVKKKHGIESRAFDITVNASDVYTAEERSYPIEDDVLILFPNIAAEWTIGYIPYGPAIQPSPEHQGSFLEELSETLRPFLPDNCLMMRYDLSWESLWAQDDAYFTGNGDWMGPPAKTSQEIRLNFETQNWNLKKANTNVLPSDTIFIDLQKDEQRLLQEMKAKTRYNIRLSHRRGVRVRTADMDDLPLWHALYLETCRRNNIHIDGIDYFRAVLETTARDTSSPADVELLIAEGAGMPLAAMFLVYSERRATYLYGASASVHRNYMAPYALQWEAIRRAKKRGCVVYDMFGVSPQPDVSHPMYGLYRFKRGFGGSLFHRMGCWDYPFDTTGYQQYTTAEMQSSGYHRG
ncbi:peptidoglycan bridge formation glycyltransferase FemA/FemB family protein [bacterium]|nr:peptidoglycan bridge formation glycyltransferase FemA/FemB family protein [bacterium]